MIKYLEISNFKSHKNTKIEFANLTVFCGANGVGKSSIIHALLLLRESFLAHSNFEYLDLQSNPVTVGIAKDALYQFSESNEISFLIKTDLQDLNFHFEAQKDADLSKTLVMRSTSKQNVFNEGLLDKENLFNKYCQYISAARLGPKQSYKKDDVVVDIYNQISVIEGQAEHFVHFLNKKKEKEVLPELINSKTESTDLFSQTTFWEREISEGVNVIVNDLGSVGYDLKYQFNTQSKIGKTNEFRAANVGFGITYVMPIIIALLASDKDGLLFIENPEAHLHPNGQSKLAELICLAAQAGIQVVIETHSDHIINGILVQNKRFETEGVGIATNNISIYHFDRNEENHSTKECKIDVEAGSKIRYTPKGFFDQFKIDRKFLLGI